MENNLEYYFKDFVSKIVNKIQKTKLVYNIEKLILDQESKEIQNIVKDYNFLTNYHYNKNIEIDEINQYTIIKIPIDSSISLHEMAKKCLKNILKSKKILINNKPIHFKECVIVDLMNTSSVALHGFHTDVEYSFFTGNAFNVWYLIENNENYGNMFILESDEYKKKYTPCSLYNKSKSMDSIDLYRDSLSLSTLLRTKRKKIGTLNKYKITYTDIKNNECLVMSKHVLHRGDGKRKNNVKGFHFRVLVKNEDGSIYRNYYNASNKFPNHRWDQKNKKLFGVELFDFA
jgi:hypothetical protein